MDKAAVNVDELVKELRNMYRAYVATDNEKPGRVFSVSADVIEEYQRREKFYTFIWNTLGNTQMRQLIDMYNEENEE